MLESFEKVPVQIYKNSTEGSNAVAAQIAALIKEKQAKKLPCVLGMATGTTPILLYKELVRLHKEESLDSIIKDQIQILKNSGFVKKDDIVVNTGSTPVQLHLPTNMIKISKVD